MEIQFINRKLIGKPHFSDLLKIVLTIQKKKVGNNHHKDYAADCMLSNNPITVGDFAALFSCTTMVQASDSTTASTLSSI